MAAIDVVNRVLREFKRFTGDNLPGEPANAPLPVGDPQSGTHNPKKAELRQALLAPIEGAAVEADRAEAAAAVAQQGIGNGLVEFDTRSLALAWPGTNPMPDTIVLRGDLTPSDGSGGVFAKGFASSDTMIVNGQSYGRTTYSNFDLMRYEELE